MVTTGRVAFKKDMTGVDAAYARQNRSCAVLTTGRIFCWGSPVPEFDRTGGGRNVAATPTLLRVGLDNRLEGSP